MMTLRCISLATVALALWVDGVAARAQGPAAAVDFPVPSPASTLRQRIGLTDIEVVYSRPSLRGREMFGAIVPYGEVWRTGANAATKISFSTPVMIDGRPLAAGWYGLYTIPGPDEWTVIFHRNATLWGANNYDPAQDALRVRVTPRALPWTVETFRISFDDLRDDSATLQLAWENVLVPVPIEVDLTERLLPQIEAVMAAGGGQKPYYQAALFFYEHDQDLQQAREWIDAAVAEQPNAYWMLHLQAKILARLGERDAAVLAAEKSTAFAVEAEGPKSGFVRMNADLVAALRAR